VVFCLFGGLFFLSVCPLPLVYTAVLEVFSLLRVRHLQSHFFLLSYLCCYCVKALICCFSSFGCEIECSLVPVKVNNLVKVLCFLNRNYYFQRANQWFFFVSVLFVPLY